MYTRAAVRETSRALVQHIQRRCALAVTGAVYARVRPLCQACCPLLRRSASRHARRPILTTLVAYGVSARDLERRRMMMLRKLLATLVFLSVPAAVAWSQDAKPT